ncbi:GntR family transcriptional regulator [Actinoplanes italicus]|uniref:DNA-binding GntR family transcriptional regulator n=1 Tax=Actinoplanes italicus TaxID=113567 RepID=A0A2T0JZP1_9ACTN|nr:GntR family transcriptional regulator [Actinoplanes italicus]PRX15976.1 DNA-binding GntR family transcriptional regulator [Actinoplanes italicus]
MGGGSSSAKYAHIVDVLRERIVRGAYPLGSMLPSESQLVREFGASRSTVVRALEYLRQLGYLEGVQGKGRLVLGTPPRRRPSPPARTYESLHAPEVGNGTVVGAGRAPASARIAAMLAVPVGEPVIVRQRIMMGSAVPWSTLSTVYLPAVAAVGTRFADVDPLREGVLDHLERRRRLVATDVVERMTLRAPSARESTLLAVSTDDVVLAILLVVRNSAASPLLAIDLAGILPPAGIEELFSLR